MSFVVATSRRAPCFHGFLSARCRIANKRRLCPRRIPIFYRSVASSYIVDDAPRFSEDQNIQAFLGLKDFEIKTSFREEDDFDLPKKAKKKKQKNRRLALYDIPQEYQKELDAYFAEGEAASPDQDKVKGSLFWKAIRRAAKQRLDKVPIDASEIEQRIAAFHEGLFVEELHAIAILRRCQLIVDHIKLDEDDIGNSTYNDSLFTLDISSVAESLETHKSDGGLLRGIDVSIRCAEGRVFNAKVQPGIHLNDLLVSAPQDLHDASGPFELQFTPQRFTMRAMHQALDTNVTKELMQTHPLLNLEASLDPGNIFVERVRNKTNDCQRRFLELFMRARPVQPTLVWGPPGTGKSTMGAFLIFLLLQQNPDVSILVAAPSNNAADVFCGKLQKLGITPNDMLRLNAVGRSPGTVPDSISEFCYEQIFEGRRIHAIPTLDELRDYKVVVATCTSAAHIANKLRKNSLDGWFSHVVVDEAGEATEPETLIALSLCHPLGRTALLGDHFQLPPLVVSPIAKGLARLDQSMLERLATERSRDAWRAEKGSEGLGGGPVHMIERGFHFLCESYRSHPDIMNLYSVVSYNKQLLHVRRPAQEAMLDYFDSLGVKSPLLMHNVVGLEKNHGQIAPSFFNPEEINIVKGYLKGLIGNPKWCLNPGKIGIITPYTMQVSELEKMVRKLGPKFQGIDIGTIEKFQGQERAVIIFSAVRSSRKEFPSERSPIGFVSDRRRLNVAISRAVAGIIIVGDLKTLSSHSEDWRILVDLASEAGALKGDVASSSELLAQKQRSKQEPRTSHQALDKKLPVSDAWDILTS